MSYLYLDFDTIRNIILKNIEKDLDSESITLSELNKRSIDINKLPKWAYNNLVDYGYLTYVDIYRGFLDSEKDKKKIERTVLAE